MGMLDSNELTMALMTGELDAKRRINKIEADFKERVGIAQTATFDMQVMQSMLDMAKDAGVDSSIMQERAKDMMDLQLQRMGLQPIQQPQSSTV